MPTVDYPLIHSHTDQWCWSPLTAKSAHITHSSSLRSWLQPFFCTASPWELGKYLSEQIRKSTLMMADILKTNLLLFVFLILFIVFCGGIRKWTGRNEGMSCKVRADCERWWPVVVCSLSPVHTRRPERSSDRSGRTSKPRTSSCWTRCPSSTTAASTTSSPALRLSFGRRLVTPPGDARTMRRSRTHAQHTPTPQCVVPPSWAWVKQWIKCLMEGSV